MRPFLAHLLCALLLVSAGAAHAQGRLGAPITYAHAGRNEPMALASVEPGLAGGDQNSYGYGAPPAQPRQGAVIDIRRNAQPQTQAPERRETTTAPPSHSEAGAPAWLETERVGPPYQANGRWYVPTPEPGYSENGTASWYGPTFHGQATASGETFDQEALSAAHPTLPLQSLVQVTNLANGREVIVRINDRGPFVGDRVIDLSHRAAEVLGFDQSGTARVNVRYLGPAPRHVQADGRQAPLSSPPPASPAPEQQSSAPYSGGPVSLLPPSQVGAPDLLHTQPAAWSPPAVHALSPPPAAGEGYMVQVGAYSDLINAHRVKALVQSAGPSAVDVRTGAGGELYRVRLGPFQTRAEAEAARQSLAGLGYPDAILAAR